MLFREGFESTSLAVCGLSIASAVAQQAPHPPAATPQRQKCTVWLATGILIRFRDSRSLLKPRELIRAELITLFRAKRISRREVSSQGLRTSK